MRAFVAGPHDAGHQRSRVSTRFSGAACSASARICSAPERSSSVAPANAIACLREDGRGGDVATHSSGNHGAALALAARLDGRTAHVVMPENSSRMKIDAVRGYGGQVHFCAPTNEARARALEALVQQGMIPVHPYDDANIIAGQGTAALELEQAVPSLEQVITPIGGGGLIGGTAIATPRLGCFRLRRGARRCGGYGGEPATRRDRDAFQPRYHRRRSAGDRRPAQFPGNPGAREAGVHGQRRRDPRGDDP